MQIQLRWTDPATGEQREPVLQTPIAIGKEFALMPGVLDGNSVSRVVLADEQVADYHALIMLQNEELLIVDQNSRTGIQINGARLPSSSLQDGDRLQIGAYEILVKTQVGVDTDPEAGCDRMVGFLFKRRCNRTSSVGCPHCNNGELNQDPYLYERSYYPGYGRYDSGYWGSTYYYDRDQYYYNSATGTVDFTEADNASFENEADTDFEQDMGAS